MAPPIRRFLAEGAEVLHEDSNSMERLMMYLENLLRTLCHTLNEVNFAHILDAIWAELSVIMYDVIQSSLDKRRLPAFFQNLRQTLYVMISCFKTGNVVTSDIEVLTEIERILDLHALETADLIHHYYLERLGHPKEFNKSEYGQLTIRANFIETDLKDQQQKQNSLILFSIKDKDFRMTNQYIAECYITFADLLANENDQIHMELYRPEYTASETIRVLEYRQGDKQAKDFLKKIKKKKS
ncbi:hypothetical protein GQX74_014530 [Glossina fuscipes]|nr:hypothetical protein GQX74_014530 [Glossina fuscipes]